MVQYNLDEQASGAIRHMAAGVSQISFTSIDVTGDQATVMASEDVWAQLGQVQDGGGVAVVHPKGTLLVTLALQRTSGTWFITEFRKSFAPGSEP